MNYSDEVKLTIRDLKNLSKAFSSASNDFYGDKAMINTQLMLLKNNNFGLDSTDIIYNDISKVMKDFDSLVHKLKQMSSDLEVASKSYKDADNSFERKVNGVLYTSMNEVMDFGEDLWEKYKETPEKGAAFMGAAFDSAKDMTLGMFNLAMYGLYMKAHPVEYGKELYREACEVYKCFKNPKKGIDNLGSVGKALLGINDKEMKNAAIHGDNYTIEKNTYLGSINAMLMVDTGAGLLEKLGKVGKAAEVEQNISKVSKLESFSNKVSVFAKDIPSIEDKLANFREFLANKLRSVTNEIPSPQLVRDSMGNTYMIWAKKVEGSGGEIVKSEKVVKEVSNPENHDYREWGDCPVSGDYKLDSTGLRIAKIKDIKNVKSYMEDNNVKLIIDKKGKILPDNAAGGFNYNTGEIVLRDKPSFLSLEHERYHAEQYIKLGKEKYLEQTVLEREEYVYNEIMKNKELFISDEIFESQRYIYKLRNGNWPPPNWKGFTE